MLRSAVGSQLSRESVGWATSLAVHLAGGLAAWMMAGAVSTLEPNLSGRTSPVKLTAAWQEPVEPERREQVVTIDMEVSIRQCECEARAADHTFGHRSIDVSQPSAEEVALAERWTAVRSPVVRRRVPRSDRSEPVNQVPPPTRAPHRPPPTPKVVVAEASVSPSLPEDSSVGTDMEDPPRLLTNFPPRYPAQAVVNRWEGTVLLRLRVGTDGGVETVEVITSSGHPILDAAAVRAVRGWRFRPARRSGRRVACTVRQPLRFVLTP